LKIAFDKLFTMVCRRFLSDKIGEVGCIDQIGGRDAAKWIMQIVIIKFKIPFVCFTNNNDYYMLQYVYYM